MIAVWNGAPAMARRRPDDLHRGDDGATGKMLRALLFFAASLPAAQGQDDLGTQVHALFTLKCTECHGPELSQPEGELGFVTDLARLAGDAHYIVKGRPADSFLYRKLTDPDPEMRMPPPDARRGGLAPADIDLVRRWIESLAPAGLEDGPQDEAGHSHPEAMEDHHHDAGGRSFLDRLVRWLGNLHPSVVHFPIALLLLAAVLDAWGRRRGTHAALQPAVRIAFRVGAGASVVAAGLGWLAGLHGHEGWVLTTHRWLGVSVAVLATTGALLDARMSRDGAPWRWTPAVLWIPALLAAVTGFFGGAVVRGIGHLAF